MTEEVILTQETFDKLQKDISAFKMQTQYLTDVVEGMITDKNLHDNAITTPKVTDDAITADKIIANAITASKIAVGTITEDKIEDGTISADKIKAGTITTLQIAATTIKASNIAAGAITANEIAASTITGAKIAATTIEAGNIKSGIITSTQIAAGTIEASNIKSGTITTTQIAAGTIVSNDIHNGTITGSDIAATTISGSNIITGTITGTQIATGTITAEKYNELRNTYVFNGDDSLDSDHPFELDFEIVSEMTSINSIKLSFRIRKFRAYSKGGAAASFYTGVQANQSLNDGTPADVYPGWISYGGDVGAEDTDMVVKTIKVVNHNHYIGNHSHTALYGIYEEDTSPTINVYIDNGSGYGNSIGSYNADQLDINITAHISGTGFKRVKFESNLRCRIAGWVMCKIDLSA